ncbi:MAG: TrkA family potassium uptake protein [Haloferacaceae archaeon]|jgi:trk system potassium uptake protein TrkA
MRIVVVGGGRVGLRTARLLVDRGHDAVIVERDPERCETLSDEYVATVVEGDGTNPGILRQTGLDRTDALVALTNDTGENLTACLIADRLSSGDVRTVMRVIGDKEAPYREFVDATVYPERAGGRMAANAVEPGIQALEEVSGTVEIAEITVNEGAPVANRSLSEVAFPRGALVVSDVSTDRIAGPDTELIPGRTYVVAIAEGVGDEVSNLMRG